MTRQLTNALDHLYDIPFLRVHPLVSLIEGDASQGSKEKGWKLHDLLLDLLEELRPGAGSEPESREWRRYRLMSMHYLDGKKPEEIAKELSIVPRSYYRERTEAIQILADLLIQRIDKDKIDTPEEVVSDTGEAIPDRRELLRQEATKSSGARHFENIEELVLETLALLSEAMTRRNIRVVADYSSDLPEIYVDSGILRQLLIGILGHLVRCSEDIDLSISLKYRENEVDLQVSANPQDRVRVDENSGGTVPGLVEIAALCPARLEAVQVGRRVTGYRVLFQAGNRKTILIVDDNADMLNLMGRYLVENHFNVLTASTAAETIEKATRYHPYAITLDLMMPNRDGWSLLQYLTNQPETRDIPVIICSVLKQNELALMMGAARFLGKPFTEQALLETLASLSSEG